MPYEYRDCKECKGTGWVTGRRGALTKCRAPNCDNGKIKITVSGGKAAAKRFWSSASVRKRSPFRRPRGWKAE